MNTELFKKNICTPLAEMTERNDHSGAVEYVADYLNDLTNNSLISRIRERGNESADLLKWAKYVKDEHSRIGHLPEPLLDFRNRIQHECLRILHDYLPNECIEALKASL